MTVDDRDELLPGFDLPRGSLWPPEVPGELRDQIYERTVRVVVRRRRLRTLGFATMAAGLFLIGGAIGYAVRGDGEGPGGPVVRVPEAVTAAVTEPGRPASPEQLERRAHLARSPKRSWLYRKAGDIYLAERGDVGAAMRCYQRHLRDLGPEERRRMQSEDSWLLASLRLDV